jgi:hypothetical protein
LVEKNLLEFLVHPELSHEYFNAEHNFLAKPMNILRCYMNAGKIFDKKRTKSFSGIMDPAIRG